MMAILTWCEVIRLCSFDLHFSNNEWFELFFMHLSTIYTSLEKYLFRSSAHFLTGLLMNSWVDIELMTHLYILQINPLSVAPFAIIFSHTEGWHFILFIVSFAMQTTWVSSSELDERRVCSYRVRALPMAQWIKNPPAMQETQEMRVWSLCQEEPLEKEMVTHSSILGWKIAWTEKLGGLQSKG